ncbi:hypothetical protein N802_02070 [Knoellia sinensis KCTC 19936]|uniref:T6SS immunity protein Tdi1 C-terminal domain-containing protein n=1 Tax=Knoellia sinensis KCTC 19936 TaxID=1385520 RepID=A0A0A0JD35_9MICO|nr:T6SS immunity protein Tdi1 domain-containing protein [Knoellia sinensis]KGN35043.1 hypothetical protein N802_02070 [Knoellia sinensis KCTC 19936]
MFERFLAAFAVSDGPSVAPRVPVTSVELWLDAAGGRAFEGGLYRVHTRPSARASDALVREAFPEFAGRLSCFGYDWLGRQFATDSGRGKDGDPEVMLFEPGSGEALEIPVPFSRFHDEELIDYTEEALARSFFDEWRRSGGQAPKIAECVGYQRPLFLGGDDAVANLEISDLDVYWTIMGQFRRQAKGLPKGTPITAVVRDQS